jgi:glyoxylase-like metal-dependent hydrolase (beta-lactamase superfamily II)
MKLVMYLVLATTLAMAAENPQTVAERSQARARAVLDSAVAAIGGADALQSVEVVKLQLQGETWPRLQMPTPEPPFESASFDETLVLDLRNNRLLLEQRNRGAGFEGHNRTVLKAGEGMNYDLRARIATPIPGVLTSQQQFVQYYRRLPNLILRQALSRASTLRHLGEEAIDGRNHNVITFVMPDAQQVALYIDSKSGLLSKYELIYTDPLTGEDASEIMFSDYTSVGALKVPQTWTWRQAGDIVAKYKVRAEFNPAVTEQTFDVATEGFRQVNPPPLAPAANVETLADGVHVIHNVAGPNQNTLAVAFKDYVLAVEAPGTSAGTEEVIKRIKEVIPGKPIRYIGMTHHHGDHIGGLRTFIAEGSTVVTTRANRKVVETMATAKQADRLASNPRTPQFDFLENGKRVFSDGTQTVELIDIGPHPHAKEMVIAYLPRHRIVFQGDLFFVPNNDAPFGPPQASTIAFGQKLKEKGLTVDKIASVHGRTATIDQFNEAMRARTSTSSQSRER